MNILKQKSINHQLPLESLIKRLEVQCNCNKLATILPSLFQDASKCTLESDSVKL